MAIREIITKGNELLDKKQEAEDGITALFITISEIKKDIEIFPTELQFLSTFKNFLMFRTTKEQH